MSNTCKMNQKGLKWILNITLKTVKFLFEYLGPNSGIQYLYLVIYQELTTLRSSSK